MLEHLRVPLSWTELAKRTWNEILADDLLNLAAQQAYYFFFALFPALLTLISVASFFPVANLIDEVVRLMGRFAPPDVLTIITDQIARISESKQGSILTFAFALTLWSSSGAMVSIITTLNAAYDITEGRPWWKTRLTAIALTLGVALFILISISLVLVGPTFAEHIAASLHLGAAFKWTWLLLQWPVVFAMVATGIGLVYYFAPDAEQDWVWITPGSIVATILWVVVSLGFKLYIAYFGSYNETYGTLGAFIMLLTWFYLSGLAILVGAEMNAEIEHASSYGKDVGEKAPGEKKKIGLLARRGYEEQKAKGEAPAAPVSPTRSTAISIGRCHRRSNPAYARATSSSGPRRSCLQPSRSARRSGRRSSRSSGGTTPPKLLVFPGIRAALAAPSPVLELSRLLRPRRGRAFRQLVARRGALPVRRSLMLAHPPDNGDVDRHRHRNLADLRLLIVMIDDDHLRLRHEGSRLRDLERLVHGHRRDRRPPAPHDRHQHALAEPGGLQRLQRLRVDAEHRPVNVDQGQQHFVSQARARELDEVTEGERARAGRDEQCRKNQEKN